MFLLDQLRPVQRSVIVFLLIILVAHLVVNATEAEYYQWYTNSLSDLAAQQYEYKWIMQGGFWLFGSTLAWSTINKIRSTRQFTGADFFVVLYALFIFMTGIFSIKPFFPVEAFALREDQLHSLFATLTGIAISLAIVSHAFPLTQKNRARSYLDFTFAFLVIATSALFGVLESDSSAYVGLIQRILWVWGLSWLMWIY